MSEYTQQLAKAKRSQKLVWILSALVLCVILWANFASLDEVVNGEGTLIPSSAVQKIQSLDGGILQQLHVQQGDIVSEGQLLVSLDETRARASFAEAEAELKSLSASKKRLLAQLDAIQGTKIVLQADVQLGTEKDNYLASLKELQVRVDAAEERILQGEQNFAEAEKNLQTLQSSFKLLDDELALTKKAVESGALSASELRKMERERVTTQGQIDAEFIQLEKLQSQITESQQNRDLLFDEFSRKTRQDISDHQARIERLQQMLAGLENQLESTRLYASMAGTVKRIELPSIGGVIRPGETIMELVPSNDELIVETRIMPKDIARVQEGQQAIIKFSAYDFVIYGGLKGQVTHITPDAILDEKGNSFFIAHIVTETGDDVDIKWQNRSLIPGMQAQIDILSGKKTVLEYWLKPLLRATQVAMREP